MKQLNNVDKLITVLSIVFAIYTILVVFSN